MQGDKLAARECYLAMLAMDEHVQTMSIDERRVTVEPTEVLEDVLLYESNPKKFTRIRASMEKKTKQDLVHFLRKTLMSLRGVMKTCQELTQVLLLID